MKRAAGCCSGATCGYDIFTVADLSDPAVENCLLEDVRVIRTNINMTGVFI